MSSACSICVCGWRGEAPLGSWVGNWVKSALLAWWVCSNMAIVCHTYYCFLNENKYIFRSTSINRKSTNNNHEDCTCHHSACDCAGCQCRHRGKSTKWRGGGESVGVFYLCKRPVGWFLGEVYCNWVHQQNWNRFLILLSIFAGFCGGWEGLRFFCCQKLLYLFLLKGFSQTSENHTLLLSELQFWHQQLLSIIFHRHPWPGPEILWLEIMI